MAVKRQRAARKRSRSAAAPGPAAAAAAAAAAETVTVTAKADRGTVEIQAIAYNGAKDTTAPFEFVRVAGPKNLAVTFAATDPLAVVDFHAADSTGEKLLGQRAGVQNKAIFSID